MKSFKIHLSILFVVLTVTAGCGNSGAFISSNTTSVELSEANYSYLAYNLSGEAETSYVFGASVSWGLSTNTYGLIPLGESAETSLYQKAQTQLWENIKTEIGEIQGRKIALVNYRYDASTINFFFYTSANLVITADVIEFE